MTVDYYSLLTKAVAGKDGVARDEIYKDAFSLITRSHLARAAASAHAAALEDAVRRIEDDIAGEEANSAAAINEVLSTGRNWKPLVIAAALLIHGTNSPKTIGHLVASACIRLVNDDVEDLYRRAS